MIAGPQVRELLERDDDPVLMLPRGRAEVAPARETDSERSPGALRVVSGREL
ncbi:hypothetical protein [Streptomyces sp. NPDC058291]|uniref:hypothetical protein n=1 Tax=Streptomyces sp. NPDC058291 TaxID=3346427 RepID=UPI0036EDDBE4